MDPASLSNLDPKLKETYERVMGTTTPADTSTPPPPPVDGAVSPEQTADSAPSPDPVTPATSVDTMTSSPQSAPADGLSATLSTPPTQNAVADSDQPQTVTINQPIPTQAAPSNILPQQPHGHLGLIKIFYVLGATVFFVIYVFFWMKIFNFSLPF